MKPEKISYEGFRLSKLRDPRFSHLKILFLWIPYLIFYAAAQQVFSADSYYTISCAWDDLFPFCEYFVIPYVFWYFMIFGSYWYFLRYNIESFKKYSYFLLATQIIGCLTFFLFPTSFPGRPDPLVVDGPFSFVISLIYFVDNATNVFPSLHCAFCMAMTSVWLKDRTASRFQKWSVVIWSILICLSTVMIKQHSVLDFFGSAAMCLVIELVLYGKSYYLPKFRRKKA